MSETKSIALVCPPDENAPVWHHQLVALLRAQGLALATQGGGQARPRKSLLEKLEAASFGRLFAEPDAYERAIALPAASADTPAWLGINLSGALQVPASPSPDPSPTHGWITPILQSGETKGTEDCLLFWHKTPSAPAVLIGRGRARSFAYSWTENDRRSGSHLAFLTADTIAALAQGNAFTALPDPAPPLNRRRGLGAFLAMAYQAVRRVYEQRFTNEQWHVLYHPSAPLNVPQQDYFRLVPPPDRFWADPFAVHQDGKTYLFLEELEFSTNHGKLIALQVEGGEVIQDWPVLDFPYHSSYPFMVRHDGRLFMIPETAANQQIDLYECTRFPDKWERHRTLVADCNAGDSSLHFHNGLWYLFTNVGRGADMSYCNELHLFTADNLLTGEFKPHPASPVSRDCRTARMGGGLYQKDGELLRVTQKGNGRIYGEALNLMRVTALSPDQYSEEFVRTITPEGADDLIGLHHMSYHDGITAMDALKRIAKR